MRSYRRLWGNSRGSRSYTPSTSVQMRHPQASKAAASATAVVSLPPRPSVVMSPSRSTPWNPATITIFPASSSRRMRRRCSAVISAAAWLPSVWMPACQPVRETAESPLSCRVMAISAADACSPVANSWSASRQAGCAVSSAVLCSRRSVVFPCAETTAIIWKPAAAASASCPAAQRSPAASATEEPPNL